MKPSVVIPGFFPTSLGTARCLQGTGFQIVSLGVPDVAHKAPLYYSRIPHRRFVVPEGRGLVESLLDIRDEFEDDPVLLLTSDRQVLEVADGFEEVSSAYRVSIPPAPVVRSLIDKVEFLAKVEELDILVPRSIAVRDDDDWVSITRELSFPLIVKPYLHHARRVDDQQELTAFLQSLEPLQRETVLAQEWIPGGDDQLVCTFAVLDGDARTLAAFTLQKLRQWRPRSGTTSLCRSTLDEEVRSEGVRILEGLGITGFASVEFKRHPEDGRLYLMEPTVGRFNQQIALSRAAGVNLPAILAAHLSGLALPPTRERAGALWIHELNDFLSSRDSRQTVRGGYVQKLVTADVRVFCSLADPFPALAACRSLMKRILSRHSGQRLEQREPMTTP